MRYTMAPLYFPAHKAGVGRDDFFVQSAELLPGECRRHHNFSTSSPRGCHFARRVSSLPTAPCSHRKYLPPEESGSRRHAPSPDIRQPRRRQTRGRPRYANLRIPCSWRWASSSIETKVQVMPCGSSAGGPAENAGSGAAAVKPETALWPAVKIRWYRFWRDRFSQA